MAAPNAQVRFITDSIFNAFSLSNQSTAKMAAKIVPYLGANYDVYAHSQDGGKLSSHLLNKWTMEVASTYDEDRAANILVIEGGANDFMIDGDSPSEIVASYQAIATPARAAGWRVVVCTLPAFRDTNLSQAAADAQEAGRLLINQAIRDAAASWDGIIDLGADAKIGSYAETSNNGLTTDNYLSDRLHHTERGIEDRDLPLVLEAIAELADAPLSAAFWVPQTLAFGTSLTPRNAEIGFDGTETFEWKVNDEVVSNSQNPTIPGLMRGANIVRRTITQGATTIYFERTVTVTGIVGADYVLLNALENFLSNLDSATDKWFKVSGSSTINATTGAFTAHSSPETPVIKVFTSLYEFIPTFLTVDGGENVTGLSGAPDGTSLRTDYIMKRDGDEFWVYWYNATPNNPDHRRITVQNVASEGVYYDGVTFTNTQDAGENYSHSPTNGDIYKFKRVNGNQLELRINSNPTPVRTFTGFTSANAFRFVGGFFAGLTGIQLPRIDFISAEPSRTMQHSKTVNVVASLPDLIRPSQVTDLEIISIDGRNVTLDSDEATDNLDTDLDYRTQRADNPEFSGAVDIDHADTEYVDTVPEITETITYYWRRLAFDGTNYSLLPSNVVAHEFVYVPPPAFSAPESAEIGEPVELTDETTGDPVSFNVDWGDGSASNGMPDLNILHRYRRIGDYTISVVAIYAGDESEPVSHDITITEDLLPWEQAEFLARIDRIDQADGSALTVLTDLSGNERNATSGAGWTFETNVVNGKPVVRSSGTQVSFKTASEPVTIRCGFMVVKFNEETFSDFDGLLTDLSSMVVLHGMNGEARFVDASVVEGFEVFRWFEYRLNDRIYPQAVQPAPMNSFGLIFFRFWGNITLDGIQIGGDRNLANRKPNMDLAAVGLYSGDFCEEDVQKYSERLAEFYSLTLADVCPLQGSKSDETVYSLAANVYDPPEGNRIAEVLEEDFKQSFDLNFTNRRDAEFKEFLAHYKSHFPELSFLYRDYNTLPPEDVEGYYDSAITKSGAINQISFSVRFKQK